MLQSGSSGYCAHYEFSLSSLTDPAGYRVAREEDRFIEKPLYLIKKYFLTREKQPDFPIQITCALAWDGYPQAVDFLTGFIASLDLFFNPDKILDTRSIGLGNFGFAWGWVQGEINVLTFIRNNVFVGIQGFLPAGRMKEIALDIDVNLAVHTSTEGYREAEQNRYLERTRTARLTTLHPGERFDLGKQLPGMGKFFFAAPEGSVNRDLQQTDNWYYRAGINTGLHPITLFRIAEGSLPVYEKTEILVTAE